MEYAGGGELYVHVHEKGRLQEDEAKLIFAQIVSAIEHMVVFITFQTIFYRFLAFEKCRPS